VNSLDLPAPFQVFTADLTASAGVVITAALLVGFRHYGGDFQVLAGGIHGNECQIRRTDVLGGIGNVILDVDFEALG